ncbi:MAG: 3-isopropylmalate dehydratase large subunit [Desulfobacterales bacterium]|nr:3-isopropylmalate dehydratase large subunit [Desulfobacterales bacterium]
MGMTITQKILADHTGLGEVYPGQPINARVDIALGNDIGAPIAIEGFRKAGAEQVFGKERVVLIPDHFTPNKDIRSAEQCKILREFAREQGLTQYFEVGQAGIEHALLPEKGIVLPGDLVIGTDSHTCTYGALGAFSTGVGSTDFAATMITGELWFKVPETIKLIYRGKLKPWVSGKDLILYTIGRIGVDGALYKAMEFVGDTIDHLPMSGRFTVANMAVEAGAKNGIFIPDSTTEEYIRSRAKRGYRFYASDDDADYSEILEFDVSEIDPQVAFPYLPSNTKGIGEVGEIFIDQAVIGSCTNGRLDDLRVAAKVLKGHKVSEDVRLIIIPATPSIYRQAMKEGLFMIFLDAGAVISPPTCGPCVGGHMGVLAKGERAIATTNRNFVGRMGHPDSEVYLSNPALAAASAVLGRIGGPEELGHRG